MLRRSTRRLATFMVNSEGPVHPDVKWGNSSQGYRGPGWVGYHKVLPQESLMMQAGNTPTDCADRVGPILDPEDPRHPIAVFTMGGNTLYDGTVDKIAEGNTFEKISQSARYLQVLYDSYLEPFSLTRTSTHLEDGRNSANAGTPSLPSMGGLCSLVGNVMVTGYNVFGDNVTIRADQNGVRIGMGSVIMDNVTMITDKSSNLLAYTRYDELNPYQQQDIFTGAIDIGANVIVEQGCFIDSCLICDQARIGHNTHIMKGCYIEQLGQTLPGSVLIANTRINYGELWGGAPARKLGKISKLEYKRGYAPSNFLNERLQDQYLDNTNEGDQNIERVLIGRDLERLLVQYDKHVTPETRAKINEFVEGREPWHHKITRMLQGWQPSSRTDDRQFQLSPPMSQVYNWAEHNVDAKQGKWAGSKYLPSNIYQDYLW